MNKNILKGDTTNIFKKVWKMYRDWDWSPAVNFVVILVLIVGGLIKYLIYQDLQAYPYGDYELTFRVHYTNTTFTDYTVTHNRPIFIGTSEGANYVKKYNACYVIETTAPIEKIRYVNHQK